jgi:hypothetical protein
MATPADQRILELLDRWLGSLELHSKYAALDDDAYWKVQAWVPHQRPTRWIIELATQKTRALRDLVQERIDMGDARFAEALESTIFLANLVGIQNIERFIPRADPAAGATATAADEPTGTLRMPAFTASMLREPPEAATKRVARGERKKAQKPPLRGKAAARATAPDPPGAAADADPQLTPAQRAEAERAAVIADAVRLLQWGRSWHELAELIARMAGRPALTEVRRLLRENKTVIDEKAGQS